MRNYGLTWTDTAGVHRAAGVGYDKPSADDRKAQLEAEGCTDVEIVETRPGELAQPRR